MRAGVVEGQADDAHAVGLDDGQWLFQREGLL